MRLWPFGPMLVVHSRDNVYRRRRIHLFAPSQEKLLARLYEDLQQRPAMDVHLEAYDLYIATRDYGMVEHLGRKVHDKGVAAFCALCRDLPMRDGGSAPPASVETFARMRLAGPARSTPLRSCNPYSTRHGLQVKLTGDRVQTSNERSQDNGQTDPTEKPFSHWAKWEEQTRGSRREPKTETEEGREALPGH